jgi:hypothetical protein
MESFVDLIRITGSASADWESTMKSLGDLHDATLLELKLFWATGELVFVFKVGVAESDIAYLQATGLIRLKCSRQFPWGRSVSVNSARADKSDDRVTLFIEMQSGDLIEAEVKDFLLK